MAQTKPFAAQSPTSGVAPHSIERRTPRADDISIDIDYCGVCHTDIHFAGNDWGSTRYPVVPGHEIIGRITAVGPGWQTSNAGRFADWRHARNLGSTRFLCKT